MIDRSHTLALATQARLLGIARSTVYREPEPVSAIDLGVMRRIDELHLNYPFAGSRMLRAMLVNEGIAIGRTHVRTLMSRMGIEALYRRPRTSKPAPGHTIYPYLLRDVAVIGSNQGWAADISVPRQAAWEMWTAPTHSACRSRLQSTVSGADQKSGS